MATYLVSRRQTKLAERQVQLAEAQHALEEELKRYQLEDARAARTLPRLKVEIRRPAPNKYPELRIRNEGGATAYDVDFEVKDAARQSIRLSGSIGYKLPVERLDPDGEAGFPIAVHVTTPSPLTVHLRWRNPDGTEDERTLQLMW